MISYLLKHIIIIATLPIIIISGDEIDYGNHNTNWEDGLASWEEFGHDNSACNIPRLTVEEWERGRYWEGIKPVIVRGVTDNWAANTNWKLQEMLRRYPNAEATMGDSRYIGQNGPEHSRSMLTTTTITEFITKHMYNPTKYFFDRKISIPKGMLEDCNPFPYPTRAFFQEKNLEYHHQYYWRDHLTISIGSNLQGLTFHYHGAAWNAVVHGAKRWILWERTSLNNTEQTRFSKDENGEVITAAEWIRTLPQHPKRIQEIKTNGHDCIQHAGEMMFIPDSVAHMVVNIGDTVAVVSEADVDMREEGGKKRNDEL